MAQIVIRNIPEDVMDGLKDIATRRGTSAEAHVRLLIADAVERERRLADFRKEATHAREELEASGRTFGDSTDLIREDRDR